MQIDGRTPSFSDNVDYPPPPYLYPTFQVQQPPLHNARHPVESSPPLYGSAASARDRAFCLSRYGIPQPELARYPESSQRTHLDDDLSRSMYRFASSSSQLPPDMLRGPNTVLPIERVEANILNERTPGRELVHCKPDNIPLEAHASHFTHQQPIASAPQLSLPTSYLPHDDAVPFSYYSSLPHRRTSNTSSASDLSPFVDSGEAMATVFNPAGFPLETRPPPPSAPTLPRHHDLNPVVAFQMGSLSPLDDSDAGPSLNPSDNSMKYHSPHHATKYGYDSTPIATPSPTIVTPSLTMPDLHGHFSESSLSSAFNDQNADCIAHSESSSPPPSHSGSESSTQPSEAPFSRSGSVVASNARPATVAITTTPRRRGKKKLSKMHECDICHKQFPRPSGLTTHQNSHAGIKPYKCSFPDCDKSFAVRSNAKRHLRTHGIFPESSDQVPGPSFAGFNPPIVSNAQYELSKATKLKWIPQSLCTRTNAAFLQSCSQLGSEIDDGSEDYAYNDTSLRPFLSAPLPAVVPSSPISHMDDEFEERNSYLGTGSHPYHPAQWRTLPGPAVMLRTQAAV